MSMYSYVKANRRRNVQWSRISRMIRSLHEIQMAIVDTITSTNIIVTHKIGLVTKRMLKTLHYKDWNPRRGEDASKL